MAEFHRCDECEVEMEEWIEVKLKVKGKEGCGINPFRGGVLEFYNRECLIKWAEKNRD